MDPWNHEIRVLQILQASQPDISPVVREKAPLILAQIKKAKSVLLHCHPSPDPDSVGSALAMKFALESLGIKATVIKGDSEIPQAFMHFPGARDIVRKNFFELDLAQFDLFVILDATIDRVSALRPIVFPAHLATINIDHHKSNTGGAAIDLVAPDYPATAQILYDLFSLWGIAITPDMARNLFIGIYTDTGGFKYTDTNPRTFAIAGELVRIAPDFPKLISNMENSNTPTFIAFEGLAFSSVQTFLGGKLGLSVISNAALLEKGIPPADASASAISAVLRSVAQWKVSGTLFEEEPGLVKMSFRSKDGQSYDVSKLAVALGGGGHKGAAGATLKLPLEAARDLVVAKAKELYNL